MDTSFRVVIKKNGLKNDMREEKKTEIERGREGEGREGE